MVRRFNAAGFKKLFTVTLVSLLAAGCAESENDSFGSQFQVLNPVDEKIIDVTDTLPEIEPEKIPQSAIEIVRGSSELEKTQALLNKKTGVVTLKGQIKIKNRSTPSVKFEFQGMIQNQREFILIASDEMKRNLPSGVEFGARALCLKNDENQCESLIVDFFLRQDKEVFIHQGQILLGEIKASEVSLPVSPKAESVPTPTPKFPQPPLTPPKKETAPVPQPSPAEPPASELEGLEDEEEHGHETDVQAGAFNTPLSEEDIQSTIDQSLGKENATPKEETKKSEIQLSGAPFSGRLLLAQNFLDSKNNHILLLRPERKRYFGTKELLQVLNWMGEYNYSLSKQKLVVGDLSAQKGGKIGSHKSHQTGLDVDLGYLIRWGNHFNSVVLSGRLVDGFLVYQQWELFKQTVKLGVIDRIFLHKSVKQAMCRVAIKNGEITKETKSGLAFETLRRLVADTEHNTHYHLRLKCPKNEVMCRQMVEPVKSSGCF